MRIAWWVESQKRSHFSSFRKGIFQDSLKTYEDFSFQNETFFREFSNIMKSDIVPSRHLLLTLHFHASSSPMDAWPFKGSGYGMKIQRWNPFVLYRRYNSFNIHYFLINTFGKVLLHHFSKRTVSDKKRKRSDYI